RDARARDGTAAHEPELAAVRDPAARDRDGRRVPDRAAQPDPAAQGTADPRGGAGRTHERRCGRPPRVTARRAHPTDDAAACGLTMSAIVTDAIVLQCFPYGETSRIVRLLTRSAGVHSAIAKGAVRPRSRFAMMEPFAEGSATLYIRSTRDLQTLGAFELARGRQGLGRDLLRFGGASLLAELVLRTASE